MIVAKSTTQKSKFLVPSQFHPQHFPVELPSQLKRISLLIYFMAIYRCPTFSVIRSNNWPCQKIHILPTYYISTYITACSNIPANFCLPFFKPKNWQQSFSVPSKFHPQHFQVQLITFFFSSQESAFYTPWHFHIFQSYSSTT